MGSSSEAMPKFGGSGRSMSAAVRGSCVVGSSPRSTLGSTGTSTGKASKSGSGLVPVGDPYVGSSPRSVLGSLGIARLGQFAFVVDKNFLEAIVNFLGVVCFGVGFGLRTALENFHGCGLRRKLGVMSVVVGDVQLGRWH